MVYERFIFWFCESPKQVDMHARSKTLKCSYNMHLCLPYLLNDSQTIHSTIHFSKPLLCVTLICGDWFRWLVIIWCTAVTRETAIFNAPKRHPVGEDEFAFSFRPTQRSIFPRWVSNMLMFNVDVNMKRLGIRLKKRLVSMIQSRLFLLRDIHFIHSALWD